MASITAKKAITTNHPKVVQNMNKFPTYKKTSSGKYVYDYKIDYNKLDFSLFQKRENQDIRSVSSLYKKQRDYYNRFKIAMPDETLNKGFMHIFFTRPDLNLRNSAGTKWVTKIARDPYMKHLINTKRDLLSALYQGSNSDHQLNLFLSNKARGFQLIDDSLETTDYGMNLFNHSIVLGRSLIKSQCSGTFEIPYYDNRDLDVLNMHKVWIQYISNVYHGIWDPKLKYMVKKTLDYACSVYVIITAEDFETIIYSGKYYGVFPINVPYSALSWTHGDVIIKPEYSITYGYSWKEDLDPTHLLELNLNSFNGKIPKSASYVPTYNSDVGHVGRTWVGPPFVEILSSPTTVMDRTSGSKEVYKLRFRRYKKS